ncbi:hypothetical protein [Streptomyces flavofungini]|uniref:Integral membrane protein n=1 Tax=Streptomyces flavofungini TaxID=68200 RepID=A0ABS0XIR4_9ACTN|nr:hypothetical protein [Streptomyces flavofungini]MBJ3813112.1 hypothetical protein [Streptomyces flavofungini]
MLIPLGTVAGTVIGLYLGIWASVVTVLAAAAVAGILVGGLWNRAGAALLAVAAVMGTGFFSGPTLHETYLKQFGERTDALVVDTAKRYNAKGHERDICRVVDTSGAVTDLGERQNCYGQFKSKQHITLFKDPHGGLDPWAEATRDRGLDTVSLSATGGMFAITVTAVFYAGARRRSGREMDARKVRKYARARRTA